MSEPAPHVVCVNGGDPIGMLDIPQFRSTTGLESAGEQLGAHCPVDE